MHNNLPVFLSHWSISEHNAGVKYPVQHFEKGNISLANRILLESHASNIIILFILSPNCPDAKGTLARLLTFLFSTQCLLECILQ